jgi:hypothetical protein
MRAIHTLALTIVVFLLCGRSGMLGGLLHFPEYCARYSRDQIFIKSSASHY